MTLPHERYYSIQATRAFLLLLATHGKLGRVPSVVRQQARALLKHYPWELHMKTLARLAPEILEETE